MLCADALIMAGNLLSVGLQTLCNPTALSIYVIPKADLFYLLMLSGYW